MTAAATARARSCSAILDGFGERAERDANAVRLAKTPHLDALAARYPHTLIGTSGPDVGLPEGRWATARSATSTSAPGASP